MGLGDLPTTSVLLNISVKWGNVVGKRNIIWRNSGASKCDTTLVRSPQASLNLAGWETTLLGLWCLSDWDNWLGLSKLSRDCCTILFTYGRYTRVYGGNILFQLPKLLPSWSHNTPRIEYVIIRLAGRHGIREKSGGRSKNILQAMKRFEELSFTHNREYLSSHQTEWVPRGGTPSSEEHWTLPIADSLDFLSLCSKLPETFLLRQLVQFQYISATLRVLWLHKIETDFH